MQSPSISATNRPVKPRTAQRGSIVAVTAIGMVALLAMAGLALDGGHMLLNKTRLQNAVDAAALSAAKSLSEAEDVGTARTDAIATFALNAAATGNHEMADAYAAGEISVIVDYSDSINPFTPDATLTDPAFVRVTVSSFPLPVWLSQVVGFTDKRVRASAVAGESPVLEERACDVAPIMACGDKNQDDWGYQQGKIEVLKLAAGSTETMGPGNAQIIAVDDSGGSDYREAAAGGYDECIAVSEDPAEYSEVISEPGVKVGPTVQGFNLRLGLPSGPLDATKYTPDVITYHEAPEVEVVTGADSVEYIVDGAGNRIDGVDSSGNITAYDSSGTSVTPNIYTHSTYEVEAATCSGDSPNSRCNANGEYDRRMLTLPIGRCDGSTAGRKPVEIFGFGCFFMIQPVSQKGNESHLFGQFVGECSAEGGFSQTPSEDTGPTRLILYKDSASGDS